MSTQVARILEFHNLYPQEPDLDIQSILRKYDREQLIRVSHVLSNNYGMGYIPDTENTFFSIENEQFYELSAKISDYLQQHNLYRIYYTTPKTALELMRWIFSIPTTEYQSCAYIEDLEYDLFRVILQINEFLMRFTSLLDGRNDLAKLMFLSRFVMNDISGQNTDDIFRTQLIYYTHLVHFLENNENFFDAKDKLLEHIGIPSFYNYFTTITSCIVHTYQANKDNIKGCRVLDVSQIKDLDGCFNTAVLDYLSIDMHSHIAYDEEAGDFTDDNVDYRYFRAHPLIKVSKNKYFIYCFPILLERLYNSLFFDLKSHYKGNLFSIYNRSFVEHVLFQQQVVKCAQHSTYFYPKKEEIIALNPPQEEPNQPDFYVREKQNLILFECKAIKLNGKLKDKNNADDLLAELKNKLYLSTHQNGKPKKQPERVGITQLLYQIQLIETYQFTWDLKIPDKVAYYPVLVIEDSKIVQPGIFYILNQWYKANKDKEFLKVMCHPIIVMSIDILYLYEHVFEAKGFHRIFDEFFNECITYNGADWVITNQLADFNEFIARKYKLSNNKAAKIHDSYMQRLGLKSKSNSL